MVQRMSASTALAIWNIFVEQQLPATAAETALSRAGVWPRAWAEFVALSFGGVLGMPGVLGSNKLSTVVMMCALVLCCFAHAGPVALVRRNVEQSQS
jgi:hypothetical protein